MKIIYAIGVVFAAFCLTGCADSKTYTDQSRFYLLEDSTLSLKPQEAWNLFQNGKFERQNTNSFNPGFTTSEFWLVVEPDPSLDNPKLEIGTAQINVIDLYRIENDSAIHVTTTGDRFTFDQRPEPALNFLFSLAKNASHYLLRIDKKNESLQLTFTTKPALAFSEWSIQSTMVIGVFTGIIVLMMIFGGFLAGITRDRVYIFYVLYVSCGWLYVMANLGYGYQYVWPDSPWFAERARPVFALLTISFSIHFLESYTGRSAYRWLRVLLQFLVWSGYLLLIVALTGIDIKSKTSLGYYFQIALPILSFLYLVAILTSLIQKIANKNTMAVFYFCSLLPIVVFTSIQLSYYSGGIDISGSYLQHYSQATGYVLESIVLTFGLAYRFNSYRLEKEQLLLDVTQQQVKYAKAIISTQEYERRQLADQLHDVAGSLLSAAKLNLSSVREKNWIVQPEAQTKLSNAEHAISHISEILRNLSHAISPVMLDKVGFKQSVEKVISIFNSSGKIRVSLEIIGFEKEQPELHEKYSILYGILYELMNNIVKHAQASEALIQVIEHDESLVMIVEDNGIGLDPTKAEFNQSQGLSAIRSKIHYLSGTIVFDKALPQGLIVTIEIPKQNEEANRTGR